MTTIEIQKQLRQFHGSNHYYNHSLANGTRILLTDGAAFIREQGECYWLFDFIAAYQTHKDIKGQIFQIWKLQKQNLAWEISCEDGNKNILYTRRIEFSDFLLDKITIWFVDGVAMLPTEY
jgi:hypothetical protein